MIRHATALGILGIGCGDAARPAVYSPSADVSFPDVGVVAAECTPGDAGLPPLDPFARGSGGQWDCIGRAPMTPTAQSAVLTVRLLLDGLPVSGTVRACARDDMRCDAPLASAEASGAGPGARLTVPLGREGFAGYVEIYVRGAMPTRTMISPPIYADYTADFFVHTPSFIAHLPGGGAVLEGRAGFVSVTAKNCVKSRAAGVRIALDAQCVGVHAGYYVNDDLDVTAEQTTENGTAIFVDLPEGRYTFSAFRRETGGRIASSAVLVRAGWMTSVALSP